MYVKQLVGRQAGQIVEMDPAVAKSAIESGTAEKPTDEEIQEAGHQVDQRDVIVEPRQITLGYRAEPALDGGFDLFDPGGVKLNKDQPYHNLPEAMNAAEQFGRRARGLPEKAEVEDDKSKAGLQPGEPIPYDKMTVEQMRAESDRRGIDSSKATKKADWIVLLERDDKVKAAIASGDLDVLTVDELKKLAAERNVDLAGKTAKPDIVDAVKAGQHATVG